MPRSLPRDGAAVSGRSGPGETHSHRVTLENVRRYARSRGTAVQKKDPLLVDRLPSLMLAMGDDLPAPCDRALP